MRSLRVPMPLATPYRAPRALDRPRRQAPSLRVRPVVHLASGTVGGWQALAADASTQAHAAPPAWGGDPVFMQEAAAALLRAATGWLDARASASAGIAVHLPAALLEDTGFCQRLHHILWVTDVPARRVTLEFSGFEGLLDLGDAIGAASRLRRSGLTIGLRGLGVGVTDPEVLRCFPAQHATLHEDIVGAFTDEEAVQTASRWVSLAADNGMRTTACGVRTVRQAQLARALGCTWGCGPLFGRPVPAWPA